MLSTALDNTGHNCNLATEAESLIMAKERFVENYGDVRYTIGTGCSGGSVVQMTVSNAYPGAVYDGLVITCSFPDVLTAGVQFADYHLLRRYFENPEHLALWPPALWGLVYGRPDPVNAIFADEALFKSATNPVGTCVPAEQAYDPVGNPGGARCSILDYMVNILGPRPREVWTDMETRAGRGFAGQPFANTGVQYGLGALEQGLITPAQFVDLNAVVGGADIDLSRARRGSPGDRQRGRQRLPLRRHQRDDPHVARGDHQPRRAGPGHRARLRARLVDPRQARRRAGSPRQRRAVVRARRRWSATRPGRARR